MISDEELREAIDRIARTRDGELLYRYFQRVVMELPLDTNPSDSALRSHNARRSFAGELMGLMAAGIADSAGSASAHATVAFVRRPAAVTRFGNSVRERIARSDPELANIFPAAGSNPHSGDTG